MEGADWLNLVVLLVLVGGGIFFKSYLDAKAQGLAKSEDINKITRKVADIKHEYDLALKAIDNQNQMRTVVAEKRMEAHQRAYTLWLDLKSSLLDDDLNSKIHECQEFWLENCLYLDQEARIAFNRAYREAHNHRSLYKMYLGSNDPDGRQYVADAHAHVMKAGGVIEKAVGLPPLHVLDMQTLSDSEIAEATPIEDGKEQTTT